MGVSRAPCTPVKVASGIECWNTPPASIASSEWWAVLACVDTTPSASSSGMRTGRLSSAFVMTASPLLVGILYDFPQHDAGASFEEAVRLGLDEAELDRPVELVPRQAAGLPGGTAHDVRRNFDELVDEGVLVIIGPSISDNGLLVREWADEARVPCVNYTGGERTRSA